MRPPISVIIEADTLSGPRPARPRILNRNASENGRNCCRHHEHGAVCDSAEAEPPEFPAGEHSHEEENNCDFGEDDGGNIKDLRDPSILEK